VVFVFINLISMHYKIGNPNRGGGAWLTGHPQLRHFFYARGTFKSFTCDRPKVKWIRNYNQSNLDCWFSSIYWFVNLQFDFIYWFNHFVNRKHTSPPIRGQSMPECLMPESPVLKLTRWHCSTKLSSMTFFYQIRVCWLLQLRHFRSGKNRMQLKLYIKLSMLPLLHRFVCI
jgi:hypothetical protein